MASIDIGQLGVWEELPDGRYKVILDIPTPRAANKNRRTVEINGPGILIGKIGHGVERGAECGKRDAEF